MLEYFRITEQNDGAHMDDLLNHLGPPVAFASEDPGQQLSPTDAQLATLLGEPNQERRDQWLDDHIEYSRHQQRAARSRGAPQLSEYDGLIPTAGNELNPSAAEMVSVD